MPISFHVPYGFDLERLRGIPGIFTKNGKITVSEDAEFIARGMGLANGRWWPSKDRERLRPHLDVTAAEVVRGWDRLNQWQRDLALALATGARHCGWHAGGLGKTASAMAALTLARANNAALQGVPVLAITRAIGRESFARDSSWIGAERVAILIGSPRENDSAKAAARRANRYMSDLREKGAQVAAVASVDEGVDFGATLFVIGWETLAESETRTYRDQAGEDREKEIGVPRADLNFAWPLIIADEAHFAANVSAARTQAFHTLADASRFGVWELTATPVQNLVRDLWAQLRAIDKWAFGARPFDFQLRYCHAKNNGYGFVANGPCEEKEGCVFCAETSTELAQRLEFYVDAKSRDEVRHLLPAKTRTIIRVPSAKAAAAIEAGKGRSSIESAIAIAAEAKKDEIEERVISGLLCDEKLVVVGNRVAWVPKIVSMLQRAIDKNKRLRDSGVWIEGVSGESHEVTARTRVVRDYMARPSRAVLVATGESIATSMDLQDTDRAIIAALPHTPGALIQLEARFHRLGGQRPVEIVFLVVEKTIDEEIERRVLRKFAATEAVGATTENASFGADLKQDEGEVVSGLLAWLSEEFKDEA